MLEVAPPLRYEEPFETSGKGRHISGAANREEFDLRFRELTLERAGGTAGRPMRQLKCHLVLMCPDGNGRCVLQGDPQVHSSAMLSPCHCGPSGREGLGTCAELKKQPRAEDGCSKRLFSAVSEEIQRGSILTTAEDGFKRTFDDPYRIAWHQRENVLASGYPPIQTLVILGHLSVQPLDVSVSMGALQPRVEELLD